MYEAGAMGEQVNYLEAVNCYTRAIQIDDGNTQALLNLGSMYEKGKGVEGGPNPETAMYYYTLAGKKGDPTAREILRVR